MLIRAEDLQRTPLKALTRHMSAEHAACQLDVLLDAELRGIASHGLLRLPRILRRIANGVTDPSQRGDQTWRAEAFLQVDGRTGLGPVVAMAAIETLETRVQRTGVALAAITNSNHIGMLGYYAEHAARKGYTLIAFSTSEALVHPWGGRTAMIGTNPVAFGIPVGEGEIFMMDAATSIVSMGEIHDHAARGKPIRQGWALDAEGRATTDAQAAKAGAISPFGGAKGYAFGLAFELLVSSLARAAIGRDVTGTLDDNTICNKGDVFILVDGPVSDLRPYLQDLRATAPAEGFDGVLIPGERGRAAREHSLAAGLELPEALWTEICAMAG